MHGEDCLSGVVEVKLVLENNQRVVFDIAEETRIPDDPQELIEAARTAPARLAFWGYQEQRALSAVRVYERRYAVLRGEMVIRAKQTLDDRTDFTYVSNDMVTAVVEGNKEVKDFRRKLDKAKEVYGVVRAVRSALEQYCFLLRKLVMPDNNAG